jgi:C-terminal processing protease CtpA/Prc
MRSVLLILVSGLALIVSIVSTHAATASDGVLTPEGAKQDVRVLKRALIELHPALTKYRTQGEIDAAFLRFETQGGAARSSSAMYLAATELAAFIRCGHTWTNVLNQSGGSKNALLQAANKLPFTIALIENRWLVLGSVVSGIKAGDEVLAVNGIAAAEMVKTMMPYLRADGSSDGKRLRQLSHDRADYSQMDIVWPLLSPPVSGQYEIQLRHRSTVKQINVKAVTLEARKSGLSKQGFTDPDETWRFRIDGNVAYMTLPTFSFWNSKFDWNVFIDVAFAEVKAKKVGYLVIDIRDNEGGDGAIGGKILTHLVKQPLQFVSDQAITMYERVPYNLVRYLDTWDYSFFDRTGQVERVSAGTAKGKYQVKDRSGIVQTIEPVAAPYTGKVFLLVSAENSSATFQMAQLTKMSGAATLIGQTTGGNQRGLNGGQLTWVTMPNSGVAVDIPLLAGRYTESTPDASVVPDIIVTRTFAPRLAGRDLEMETVMANIDYQ